MHGTKTMWKTFVIMFVYIFNVDRTRMEIMWNNIYFAVLKIEFLDLVERFNSSGIYYAHQKYEVLRYNQ